MLDDAPKKSALAVNAMAQMFINTVRRSLAGMFPGYFEDHKHNHYADFGFPTTVPFNLLYDAYRRKGVAHGAIKKTSRKIFTTKPVLTIGTDTHEETAREKEARQYFDRIRLWQCVAEADRMAMVGDYAGLILRLRDGKEFSDPVDGTPGGGIEGLLEVIPAWEGQLRVSEWHEDVAEENYGTPAMFQYNEAALVRPDTKDQGHRRRQFNVHPDRVIIFSDNGTVHGESRLRAGYNDLITIEKIVGAGGEGFWKNAKNGLAMNMDKDAQLEQMAQAMGVQVSELMDAIDTQVEDFQKGFDKVMLTQGIDTKAIEVTLPSPEHFFAAAVNSFAASIEMPVKILIGMQTGERASQEDANEWATTCMGMRSDRVVPNIMALVERLVEFKVLATADWELYWEDLTEASMEEKIDRVGKMADVNAKHKGSGLLIFTPEEMRETVGLDPKGAIKDQFGEDDEGDDDDTDMPPDDEQDETEEQD